MLCVQLEYCASVVCPTAWFSTNTAFLLPRSWVINFALFNGDIGSIYHSTLDQPHHRARGEFRRLTEFPMTRTRLLKVLRVKVGKVSTDRTGHLGAVALLSTNHMSEYTEGVRGSVSLTRGTTWHQLEVACQSKNLQKRCG